MRGSEPHAFRTWVPGLPIRDDAGGHNNCLPTRRCKMSAMLVTAKAMFERLYLVPGLVPICALCHHALGAHTPTAHAPAISQFPCNFFPEWSLNYDVSMMHQVISDYLANRADQKNEGPRFPCNCAIGNQEIVAERASGRLQGHNDKGCRLAQVLEPNTNAQRTPLLSHLLCSPWHPLAPNCWSLPRSL